MRKEEKQFIKKGIGKPVNKSIRSFYIKNITTFFRKHVPVF